MTTLWRSRHDRAGSAAELAWRLERLADCGIGFLEQNWCIGAPDARELTVTTAGVIAAAEHPPRAKRRYRAHLRRAHDQGCRSIGVPRTTITLLLNAWDSVGAATLLDEACDIAIAEICASPAGWQPDRARDVLAHAVRSRITPRAPVP